MFKNGNWMTDCLFECAESICYLIRGLCLAEDLWTRINVSFYMTLTDRPSGGLYISPTLKLQYDNVFVALKVYT